MWKKGCSGVALHNVREKTCNHLVISLKKRTFATEFMRTYMRIPYIKLKIK